MNIIHKQKYQIVIFGASGDLAKRKLYPALSSLYSKDKLPEDIKIIGYGRSYINDDQFKESAFKYCNYNDIQNNFKNKCSYIQGLYTWDEGFSKLNDVLNINSNTIFKTINDNTNEYQYDICNRVFYLSLPPNVYTDVIVDISKLFSETGWNRIVVEKPFGKDLTSFYQLRNTMFEYIPNINDTLYCMDHYLGKDYLKDIMKKRFALIDTNVISENVSLMKSLYIKERISSIHIRCFEKRGIEDRMYFDDYGIIRDVIQNHLLQIVSLFTCDAPTTDAKVRALRNIKTLKSSTLEKGQYDTYKSEKYVKPNSITETYAKLVLNIENNIYWKNVPITIEAGKGMSCDINEVRISYNDGNNVLVYRIQPDPEVSLFVKNNINGTWDIYPINKPDSKVDAYEYLLNDIVNGSKDNFVTLEEIEESWRILDDVVSMNNSLPFIYSKTNFDGTL